MGLIMIGLGFILLIAGRPAYATFVGSVGFVGGFYLAEILPVFPDEINPLLLGLILGGLGVALTFILLRWMARLAVFMSMGYVAYTLPQALGAEMEISPWLIFPVVGVIALILNFLWFDITTVVFTTLAAVTLLLQYLPLGNIDPASMFIVLTIFGLIAQYLLFQYGRPSPD